MRGNNRPLAKVLDSCFDVFQKRRKAKETLRKWRTNTVRADLQMMLGGSRPYCSDAWWRCFGSLCAELSLLARNLCKYRDLTILTHSSVVAQSMLEVPRAPAVRTGGIVRRDTVSSMDTKSSRFETISKSAHTPPNFN